MPARKTDPSLDEIRERAAEIRATWSEAERDRRRYMTPPLIKADFASVETEAEVRQFETLHRQRVGEHCG